jgi:hypothetical protein
MAPSRLAFSVLFFILLAAGDAGADFVDAILAEVDGTTITASDIGMAEGLGLFGFGPSGAAIRPAEVARMIDVRLILGEAARLGIEGSQTEVDERWRAAAGRLGGEGALSAWLERNGIERQWARRMVASDVRWHRFIEMRFRAFVFVPEMEIQETLGPGPPDREMRERVRDLVREAEVTRKLEAWLADARERAAVRRPEFELESIPRPFPMPGSTATHSGAPAPREPDIGGH